MNALLGALNAAAPKAVIILAEATLVLLAAILTHPLMSRFAARHALLLLALVTVGLCPAIVIAARHIGLAAPFSVRDLPIQLGLDRPEAATPVAHGIETASQRSFPWAALLLVVWMIGALAGMVRLNRGWHKILRIRKAARAVSGERIEGALHRVATVFNRPAPTVLASEQVGVPLAVGCYHPVVLLPVSLLLRLGDAELLQVLVHECAHVFRQDTLINLYQRFLAAVLWFHPLVHIANRLLDGAREDLCDNYVLRVAAPAEYSRTLLAVAEFFTSPPDGLLAPTLVRPAGNLEARVARLLHPRRCVITNPKSIIVGGIAATFIGAVLVLSAMTVPPAGQDYLRNNSSLSQVVKLAGTPQAIDNQGDIITVESVRGTADTLKPGNTYEVSGTYKLVTHDKALLAIEVTISNRNSPIIVRDQSGRRYVLTPLGNRNHHPRLPDQHEIVSKGEGSFTLRFHLWGAGHPHVSFYPNGGGDSFVSAYF
jgi:beta-lactamase regulating signal transducer with metallopeptidase domain